MCRCACIYIYQEKTFSVSCGSGEQRIIWLAHVALARYDNSFGLELGVPKGLKTDDGESLDNEASINETLDDGQHVWVVLKGEFLILKLANSHKNMLLTLFCLLGFEVNPIKINSK